MCVVYHELKKDSKNAIVFSRNTGCRIMVVRLLWEHVVQVRFLAPRQENKCGRRITALPQVSNLMTGVRLPSPAHSVLKQKAA